MSHIDQDILCSAVGLSEMSLQDAQAGWRLRSLLPYVITMDSCVGLCFVLQKKCDQAMDF